MMDLALRTTVVFALAFGLACVLRRATSATRHLLWHVTMLIVVTAPLLRPLAPQFEVPALLTRAMVSTLGTPSTPGIRLRSPGDQGELRRDLAEAAVEPRRRAQDTSATVSPLLLWTIGSVATAFWFAIGWLAALWIGVRATRAPARLELEARAIARELGVRRTPDVRVMQSSRGPLTVGFFHPVILLPSLALEWNVERRRAVLAHELAHLRRADTRTQALAHVACALYWFNPLAWMAARALRRERERACDDAVVALGIQASSYAQDLLEIAQGMSSRMSPSAALAMAHRSELEGRLLSILSTDRRRRPVPATKWVVSCAMVLCAIVAFGVRAAADTLRVESALSPVRPPPASVWREGALVDAASQRQQTRSAVQALAQSDSEDVRERAAIHLAVSSDPSVIDALVAALRDPSSQVREKAAMGLSLRREARVVDALLVAATDDDAQVREKVMMALGTSGDPRATAALRAGLEDRDSQVREKAAMGLVLLTSSPIGPIDRAALESGLTWAVNTVLRAIQ